MLKKTVLVLGYCLALTASAYVAVSEKVEQGKKYHLK